MTTAIIVNPADADIWIRHLHKAEDQQLTATLQAIAPDDPTSNVEQALVRVSSSDRSHRYNVRLTRYVNAIDGLVVTGECECLAGQHGNPCKHLALAFQTANYFPFPTRHEFDPALIRTGVNLLMGVKS